MICLHRNKQFSLVFWLSIFYMCRFFRSMLLLKKGYVMCTGTKYRYLYKYVQCVYSFLAVCNGNLPDRRHPQYGVSPLLQGHSRYSIYSLPSRKCTAVFLYSYCSNKIGLNSFGHRQGRETSVSSVETELGQAITHSFEKVKLLKTFFL